MTSIAQHKFRKKMQEGIMRYLSKTDAFEVEGHDVIVALYEVIEHLSRNIEGFKEDPLVRNNVISEIANYNRQLVKHLEEYAR